MESTTRLTVGNQQEVSVEGDTQVNATKLIETTHDHGSIISGHVRCGSSGPERRTSDRESKVVATHTAQLLIGVGHPNDDGLMPSSIRTLWLSENSRPAWAMGEPGRRPTHIWIPFVPDTILSDGLMMVVTLVLRQDAPWRSAGIDFDPRERRTLDLSRCLTPLQHDALLAAARAESVGTGLKVIVAAFTGSSILAQLPVVQTYGFDVEVLAPVGSRLYSRWTRTTRALGIMQEPDVPKGVLH